MVHTKQHAQQKQNKKHCVKQCAPERAIQVDVEVYFRKSVQKLIRECLVLRESHGLGPLGRRRRHIPPSTASWEKLRKLPLDWLGFRVKFGVFSSRSIFFQPSGLRHSYNTSLFAGLPVASAIATRAATAPRDASGANWWVRWPSACRDRCGGSGCLPAAMGCLCLRLCARRQSKAS